MSSRPNLIVIMSDQHSPHAMGCAGDPIVRTPNLDALAQRGVRFPNTYCAAPLCVPSRMTFMSCQYPSDISVWRNPHLLDPYTPTFATGLSLAGYETILCGRMHFAGPEQHYGFQRRLVGDVSGACDESQPKFENKIPPHTCGQDYRSVVDSGPGRSTYIAYDDAVFARACKVLRQRDRDGADKPLAMVVGGLLPHDPYICPPDLFEEYMDKVVVPADDDAAALHPAIAYWRQVRGVDRITREDARRARAAYLGLTTYLDERIGELLAALAATNFAEDTIVAYMSDHGEMAGEHGMWWKDSLYEGSAGVPMIWSAPGRFAQGATSDALGSLLDVGVTCLSLASGEPLPQARGRDLTPLLQTGQRPGDWTDRVFTEVFPNDMRPARMVRDGKWKLNHYHGYDRPQLFDLEADPHEHNDLGASPQHTDVRRELTDIVLDRWDGDDVEQRGLARERAFKTMRKWHASAQLGESEIYRYPKGSNWWTPLAK
jgi:choline-sulfatase